MSYAEIQRIQSQRSRARGVGAEASLTVEQWEETLADFEGMCAYCLKKQFDVLEHFIPIEIAGTTVKNCVPACYPCNKKKKNCTGDELRLRFGQDVIERVQQYLVNRSTTLPDCPVRCQYLIKVLPDKSTYSIQELIDYLPCRVLHLRTQAAISESTLRRIYSGEAIRPYTADRLLDTLGIIYNRSLSLNNVTGILLYEKRRQISEVENARKKGEIEKSRNDRLSSLKSFKWDKMGDDFLDDIEQLMQKHEIKLIRRS